MKEDDRAVGTLGQMEKNYMVIWEQMEEDKRAIGG